jgi:hypothetical protein
MVRADLHERAKTRARSNRTVSIYKAHVCLEMREQCFEIAIRRSTPVVLNVEA